MLGHFDAGHPPNGRVVSVCADHIVRLGRLASRDRVAGRDLAELRHLLPEGGVVRDLNKDPVPLQKQACDETDRTGANDEDLRVGVTEH